MTLIKKNGIRIAIKYNDTSKNKWDLAHRCLNKEAKSGNEIQYIEPIYKCQSNLFQLPDTEKEIKRKSSNNQYLKNWPKPPNVENQFVWYLGDNYSQLSKARKEVLEKNPNAKIKIAIIDTGIQKDHPALPEKILNGISFIDTEIGGSSIDKTSNTIYEQDGHGTATACILAGKKITKEISGNDFEGVFGAIPFAEILPIRINETVALIGSEAFVSAVKYAINQGCEVISMSMAGIPSKRWADVVNEAYTNGVVIVAAAGNSWNKGIKKLLPKRLLFPARWENVIAATGICADKKPYIFDIRPQKKSQGGETMQGNYGPSDAMVSAIAAYTPNIPWATINQKNKFFRLDGGGTSSSTPQIAAAAAMIICYGREKINLLEEKYPNEKWRKVELVKRALFNAADKSYPEYKKYYGKGTLKAYSSLKELDAIEIDSLTPSKKASVNFYGIGDFLNILILRKSDIKTKFQDIQNEMFHTEIIQAIHSNPKLFKFLDYGFEEKWSIADKKFLKEELLKSETTSKTLKNKLILLNVSRLTS